MLSGYILEVTGSYEDVGWAEGAQGFAQALVAIPAGMLADRTRRDTLLRASGLVGFVAVALTLYALFSHHARESGHYPWIVASLCVYGVFTGLWNGPFEALFADSTPTGDRTRYQAWKVTVRLIGRSVGPATSAVMFATLGNKWTPRELTNVFATGILISTLGMGAMFFFSDDRSLGDDGGGNALLDPVAVAAGGGGINGDGNQDRGRPERQALLSVNAGGGGRSRRASFGEAYERRCGCLTEKRIPYICAASDLVSGLASGMTIKFFPLFFKSKEATALSPRDVCVIWAVTPLLMAGAAHAAAWVSKSFGRVQTLQLNKACGIALLTLMAVMKPWWTRKEIIIPIYVVRTVLMNCGRPLRARSLPHFPNILRARALCSPCSLAPVTYTRRIRYLLRGSGVFPAVTAWVISNATANKTHF